VKDWSNEIVAFERNLRALRAPGGGRGLLVVTMSLMQLPAGRRRAISGMAASRRPAAELFEGVRQRATRRARRSTIGSIPLVRVFYAPPLWT